MLMNTREVATYLNISPDTFRELRRTRLDFPKPVTRTKFSRIQVDYWLATALPYVDPLTEARDILSNPIHKKRIITKDW